MTFWLDGEGTAQSALDNRELPFTPIVIEKFNDPETGRDYASYEFTCPKLTDDGRCSIYQDRPETCRIFEPGSSPLCVYYQAEAA